MLSLNPNNLIRVKMASIFDSFSTGLLAGFYLRCLRLKLFKLDDLEEKASLFFKKLPTSIRWQRTEIAGLRCCCLLCHLHGVFKAKRSDAIELSLSYLLQCGFYTVQFYTKSTLCKPLEPNVSMRLATKRSVNRIANSFRMPFLEFFSRYITLQID